MTDHREHRHRPHSHRGGSTCGSPLMQRQGSKVTESINHNKLTLAWQRLCAAFLVLAIALLAFLLFSIGPLGPYARPRGELSVDIQQCRVQIFKAHSLIVWPMVTFGPEGIWGTANLPAGDYRLHFYDCLQSNFDGDVQTVVHAGVLNLASAPGSSVER